ncbi:MAG: glucokinase [Chloroflexi bacterium]|nr:glucokinase [Chloroflexota bacterium]
MILAGDIGGTNTRLAYFAPAGDRLQPEVTTTFPSREHASLEEIVGTFVSGHHLTVERACFAVAGPIRRGRAELTNLPWIVDARQLAAHLGIAGVGVINDLAANAYGIAGLAPADLATLNAGTADTDGNIAVIAAGTGLGEAGLIWDGTRHHVFASEGGHADFAPRTELELELLRYLLPRWEHVSYERVLSGPGLLNLYSFLRDTGRGTVPSWLAEELRQRDPAAAITQASLAGTCALCEQALDLFVSIYGAAAGNLALKLMATGGVFLGGGIAPRIVRKLSGPGFLAAFTAKGRLRSLLEAVPIRVILNDQTALYGAARCAHRQP